MTRLPLETLSAGSGSVLDHGVLSLVGLLLDQLHLQAGVGELLPRGVLVVADDVGHHDVRLAGRDA